jgi:uncharacterized LabA/DUF88 family protein
MERTNVYIDGFNFYYGCIKGTPHRWLDLGAYCRTVFPNNTIHRIRYFTALVKPTAQDPTQQQRQLAYLRALATIPHLSIHYGRFSVMPKWRWLADSPPNDPPRSVKIIHVEEKGSDVNLASHLLMDGFNHDYDVAIVVSNDSDLVEPIRMVRANLHLKVGILNPYKKTARDLQGIANFYQSARQGPLSACQFASKLTDERGTIVKPVGW